ncbi:MAG: extracellular solute-binding protein [Rhodospirillales bacterium]|jgi:spermidine/putrescine transport system substrate-binding protein|nr:extracellular solute-binding protein [Rhodospirillales bacterium]
MKIKKEIDEIMTARSMGRRAFNAKLATLGLATLTLPVLPSTAKADSDMTYFTWAGYDIPELHPSYIEKHGASPSMSLFADLEEALVKLRSGFSVDVAHPCSSNIERWHEAGVLKPMDASKLTNWDNLIPAFRDMPGVSIDGQPLFIPNDWGSHSVAYRTDLIDPDYANEKGWELLLDEKYSGKLAMWDSIEAAIAFAAVILEIKDTSQVTDAQIKDMKDVLVRQKELLRTYWISESDAEAMLASGEVAASYLWSGPIYRLQEQGIPVDYLQDPKGGAISWVCGLVMPNTGKGDEQKAYDFINAWTSPDAGKYLVEAYGYGHSNSKTYDVVDPAVVEGMGLSGGVTKYLENTTPFRSWNTDLLKRYVLMFEEVKAEI